ncbi:MAG TPA: N-6 DNA methylase [Methanocella sp.]|uniref:Eco57I restriction-modification methylase domain-containing protein n=1 Tax=Methanocella sp. TaxID=2052833 RepID=UPI002BA94B55|nr:N-6 DNA methylase [Methanocella sp.]HTY90349.1 N-6 DNA methylase [Methanocella sp.]
MIFDDALSGRITPGAACARFDEAVVRHYGDLSRDAGVIYTPKAVARYICRKAIGSYLARGNSLDHIRVFDSSCGTGIFLEAAMEELYRLRVEAFVDAGKSMPPEYVLKKAIVEHNLYGMDVDRYSIDAASLRLRLLLSVINGIGPARLNLACDNALFAPRIGEFDVIVGNPPYIRVKSMSAEQKKSIPAEVKASGLFHFQKGNLNLYKLFIERNLGFLKDGGSMGLIIPSSFLNESSSEMLRKHLFDTCSLEEVVEIPERSRIFPRVNQATAIVVLNKSRANNGHLRLRMGVDSESLDNGDGSISVGYAELAGVSDGRMEVPLLSDPSLEWDMIGRLKDIPPLKGCNDVTPVGEISVGNVDETFDKEYISEAPTGDIFVKGIHLREYFVDLSPEGPQPRWVKKREFLRKRPLAANTIEHWRIIGRNTQNKACARRLKFAMLPPGYLCSNSIKQIIVTDKGIDPFYLMALLNSSTLNWYFELFCSQNNIRNYRIEALPIVRASPEVQAAFSRVARLIINSRGETREFLDKKLMDSMAYELYLKDTKAGLIGAVTAMHDPEKLISDSNIRRMVYAMRDEKEFQVIQRAAYRL